MPAVHTLEASSIFPVGMAICSLVPKPLLFYLNMETSEKWGRSGSIHHMSGCEVDVGEEGSIFEYVRTKLESKFLTDQDK